jgi:hypothetical protein
MNADDHGGLQLQKQINEINDTLAAVVFLQSKKTAEPWHVDRKIPAAIIFGFVLQAGGLIVYFKNREAEVLQRIALVESQIVQQHDRDDRQDKASTQANEQVQKRLDRIEEKIDRLIESRRR